MPDDARPTVAEPAATRWDDIPERGVSPWRVGDVIDGTYRVSRIHAAGGMGLVYHVRHLGWGMDLAVKRPRPEFFRTDDQRADFEREAEAWTNLGLHPNVIACHYVRRLADVPCVFAEYAVGGSLADRLRDGPLPLPQALDAGVQTAWGVEHAHGRGLIHQDIKPANLLLADGPSPDEARATVADSAASDSLLTVKVTDFGLAAARAAVESGSASRGPGRTLAVAGAGLFTPEYAAPEQFAGELLTRRTDIWSWAVTLLELLTGRRPAVGLAAPELLAVVDRSDWPPELGELLADCLKVDPEQRPRDMAEVAERTGRVYRRLAGLKYPRRLPRPARLDLDAKNNRGVSLADLGKSDAAEDVWAEVVRAERDHPEGGYNLGLARWRSGRVGFEEFAGDLREVAAAFPDDPRPKAFAAQVQLESGNAEAAAAALGTDLGSDGVRAAIRDHTARLPTQLWSAGGAVEVTAVVWAGADRVVTVGRDRTLRVWDANTGRLIHALTGHQGIPERLVASVDGRFVLSSGFSEEPTGAADLILWDVVEGKRLWEADPRTGLFVPLATDGELAVAFDGAALIGWVAGKCVFEVPDAGQAAYAGGSLVTTGGTSDQLIARVWDVPNPRPIREFEITPDVRDLTVTPDGVFLTGRVKGRLRHWNLSDGSERIGPPPGSTGFSINLGGPIEYTDHLLTVRQAETDRPVVLFAPHGSNSGLVAALGPGNRVATGWERGVGVWQLNPEAVPFTAPPAVCVARRSELVLAAEEACNEALSLARVAMSAGDWATAAGHVRSARSQRGANRRADALALWRELSNHLARGTFRRGWWADSLAAPGVRDLAVMPDGRRLIVSRHLGFSVWDATDGRRLAEIESPTARTVAISPDGATAFTAAGVVGRNLRITATEVATGRVIWETELPPLSVGFGELQLSGDGRTLFAVLGDHSVRRWDAATGELLATYTKRLGGVTAVAPTEDGSWFAAVDLNGAVRVFDTDTGRCRRTLVRTGATAVAVAGRQVLIGRTPGEDRPGEPARPLAAEEVLILWDAGTGERLQSFTGPLAGASCVALAADGGLAVAGYKATAAVWDADTGEFLRAFPSHADEVVEVAAATGRRTVATAAGESVRLWTLDWELTDAAPKPDSRPEPVAWDAEFEPFALVARTPAAIVPVAGPPPEPVTLSLSKLVLTPDGLFRGKPGDTLETLHRLADITAVERRGRSNTGAALLIVIALAVAVVGYREWDGWLRWTAVAGGALAALLGIAAWRFPLLRVTTATGTTEYEIRDPGDDTLAFVASLKLAAGV